MPKHTKKKAKKQASKRKASNVALGLPKDQGRRKQKEKQEFRIS